MPFPWAKASSLLSMQWLHKTPSKRRSQSFCQSACWALTWDRVGNTWDCQHNHHLTSAYSSTTIVPYIAFTVDMIMTPILTMIVGCHNIDSREGTEPAWPWWNWHGPFLTLLSKCVFIPKNWPTSRWWVTSLPANTKWPSGYKRSANPQKIIIIIMSDIPRLTLISDPTNKFPKNANNSFKVWLPECLTLQGEQWHASFLSMSVPDEGQSSGVIARDPHTKVVWLGLCMTIWKKVLGTYRRIEFKRKEYAEVLEDVMNADLFVMSGVMFWQWVMQVVKSWSNWPKIKRTCCQVIEMRFPLSLWKKTGCQPWGGKKRFDIACYTQSGTDELSQNDSSGLLCHWLFWGWKVWVRCQNTGWGVQVGTQFTIHPPRHHLHGLNRTHRPLDAIDL